MTRHRLAAAAALSLAVVLPLGIAAAQPASAVDGGFAEVASLPGTTVTSLVSPTDGEAYVSGRDATSVFLKHATAAGVKDVPVTGASATSTVQLASDGKTTYALVDGKLFTVAGETLTPMALPAFIPGTNTPVVPTSITAADGLLWVGAKITYLSSKVNWVALVPLRWDGSSWTALPRALEHVEPSATQYTTPVVRYAKAASVVVTMTALDSSSSDERAAMWDGTEWINPSWNTRPYSSAGGQNGSWVGTAWTFATYPDGYTRDFTVWGYQGVNGSYQPQTAPTGTCRHTRKLADNPCPAPAWPVTAAVRLADGRTVIGGADGVGAVASATPGAFALVDGDDATPAPLGGDNDSEVAALAAAPSGTTVWAVTQTGLAGNGAGVTGQRLQKLDLGADPTPNKAPVKPAEQFQWAVTNYGYKITSMDFDVLPGRPAVGLAGIDRNGKLQVWSRDQNQGGTEAYPTVYDIAPSGVTVRAVQNGTTTPGQRPFYVLAHGKDGAADTLLLSSDSGWQPAVTKVDLPATVPGTSDPMPTSFALATEGDTVYLVGRIPTTGHPVVLQRTGTTGTWSARVAPMAVDSMTRRAWVKDGGVFVEGTYQGQGALARVNGDGWNVITATKATYGDTTYSIRDLTPTSATGSVSWGAVQGTGWSDGFCQVNAPWAGDGCSHPSWGVTTASRFDDGHTLVGGDGTAQGSGLAIVDGPQAAPRDMEILLPTTSAWYSTTQHPEVVKVVAGHGAGAGAWAMVKTPASSVINEGRENLLIWSDLTK